MNDPFIMYPRFLQLIFDSKLPDLRKDPIHAVEIQNMDDFILTRMQYYLGKEKSEYPPVRRLFGHLVRVM